jgi:hypothetical protein
LLSSTPSITLPYPLPSIPHCSTTFSTNPYVLYLHICNAFPHCGLYHSLFFSLIPQVP